MDGAVPFIWRKNGRVDACAANVSLFGLAVSASMDVWFPAPLPPGERSMLKPSPAPTPFAVGFGAAGPPLDQGREFVELDGGGFGVVLLPFGERVFVVPDFASGAAAAGAMAR